MVVVHNEHRPGLAPVGGVNEHAPLSGLLHHALDGRRLGADDGDEPSGGYHVSKSDVDQLHALTPLFNVLYLLPDLLDLRLDVHHMAGVSMSLHLEPMVLASRLNS